jgi:hypothetical protein
VPRGRQSSPQRLSPSRGERRWIRFSFAQGTSQEHGAARVDELGALNHEQGQQRSELCARLSGEAEEFVVFVEKEGDGALRDPKGEAGVELCELGVFGPERREGRYWQSAGGVARECVACMVNLLADQVVAGLGRECLGCGAGSEEVRRSLWRVLFADDSRASRAL